MHTIEHIKAFSAAVHAHCAKPSDEATTKALLAFPLSRQAYEGLGDEAEAELHALAPYASLTLRRLRDAEHGLPWCSTSVEHDERALQSMAVDDPARVGVLGRLVECLLDRARLRVTRLIDGEGVREEVLRDLDRAEELAQKLPAEDARKTHEYLGSLLVRGKLHHDVGEESIAQIYLTHAREGFLEVLKASGPLSARGYDLRIDLLRCLALLGRHEEVQELLERVFEEAVQERDGTFPTIDFAAAALFCATQLAAQGNEAIARACCERSLALWDLCAFRLPVQEVERASTLLLSAELLEKAAFEGYRAHEPLSANAKALLESATAMLARVTEIAHAEAQAPQIGAFVVPAAFYVAQLLPLLNRPAEAMEWYKKADAYAERFGATESVLVDSMWQRAECLVHLGRLQEAADWFARARASMGPLADTELRLDRQDQVASRAFAIREQLHIPHGLDDQALLGAMAWLMLECANEERYEEAANWFERSEATRKAASLSPNTHSVRRGLGMAFVVASNLMDKGQMSRGMQIGTLASDLCHELGHISNDEASNYQFFLITITTQALSKVLELTREHWTSSPVQVKEIYRQLEEVVHRLECAFALLGDARLRDFDGLWGSASQFYAQALEESGETARALAVYDHMLARTADGSVVLEPSALDGVKLSRARLVALAELFR